MKTVFLVAGGRGGSDFFQGLLDSHKEILSFPGYLRVDEDFKKLFDQKNNIDIAKKFINLYPHFFNSKNNFIASSNIELNNLADIQIKIKRAKKSLNEEAFL